MICIFLVFYGRSCKLNVPKLFSLVVVFTIIMPYPQFSHNGTKIMPANIGAIRGSVPITFWCQKWDSVSV